MRFALVVVVTAACSSEGSPPPDASADALGEAPFSCEEYVDRSDECRTWEDVCRPDICASWDCCYVEDNEWRVLYVECMDGCGNSNVDARTN